MQDLNLLASSILSGKSGTCLVTLDEFKKLYRLLEQSAQEKNLKLGETSILLLSEKSLVRFQINQNLILRVSDNNRALNKKDFDIVLIPRFEGNIKPIPLRAFIWTEIIQNWWILTPLIIVFLFLFLHHRTITNLQTINQMLVEANALFIGIFVLFTINQNRDLLTSHELVKGGLTHQLIQNDRYITYTAVTSLLSAFISAALLGTVDGSSQQILKIYNSFTINPVLASKLFTTISLIFLTDCFLAVARYYLRVMRTALEGRMYLEIMGRESDSENSIK